MSTPPAKSSSRSASPSGPSRQQSLLALGSAAVLTVYATGFLRTEAAAQRLEAGSNARRRPAGAPRLATAGDASARPDSGAPMGTARASMGDNAPAPSPSAMAATNALPPDDSARYSLVVKQGATKGVAVRSADSTAAARTVVAPNPAPAVVAAPPTPTSAATAAATSTQPEPAAATVVSAPAATVPAPAAAPAAPPAAPSAAPSSAPAATAPKAVGWRDGTFTGWGTSRHGDIEATVVIEGGKITGAIISRCLTRYSCSWVAHLQQQVVVRQSPEVDNVSGATESANAFFYAVSEALAKSK